MHVLQHNKEDMEHVITHIKAHSKKSDQSKRQRVF